jgi:uncharacterized protein YxeA
MPLDEFQYYVKLFNQKQQDEANATAQAENRAKLDALNKEGKPIGDVIPHPPRE